jgi:hypothetical protein
MLERLFFEGGLTTELADEHGGGELLAHDPFYLLQS